MHRKRSSSLSSRRTMQQSTRTGEHSTVLSPISLAHYSESDPFLSPTSTRSTPPTPRFFHPSSPVSPSPRRSIDGYDSAGTSSRPPKNGPAAGLLGGFAVPPSAKRTRTSTWLFVGAIAIVSLLGVAVLARSGGSPAEMATSTSRASNTLAELQLQVLSGVEDEDEAAAKASFTSIVEDDGGDIALTPLPRPRLPFVGDTEPRYIGFLPHSGYHNQRIALQNALMLGKLLNRTVLLPPIWIGWPISTQYYQDLRQSWLNIMLTDPSSFNLSTLTPDSPLNLPASFATSATAYPCPSCTADNATRLDEIAADHVANMAKWRDAGYDVRPDGYPIIPSLKAEDCKSYSPECRFTYRDTFLAWDFLVDLDKARKVGVEVVDRWDLRERALLEQLGVTEDDVYVVEDRETYDFQFDDRSTSETELITDNGASSHWKRVVGIEALRHVKQRVLLIGSLFGSGRVRVRREPDADQWSEAFEQAMAFRNPWLLRPADAIVARLGGRDNYVGVHARVGDGEFARYARQNMERAWQSLVVSKMHVAEDIAEEMWERVKPAVIVGRGKKSVVKRGAVAEEDEPSSWSPLDERGDVGAETSTHSSSRAKRGLLDDVKALLPSFGEDVEPSTRLRNLTCRAPLHTDPRFKPFNVPLYLATDSRTPEQDLNLRPFFDAFPCTFVLGDFDRPDPARNDGVVVGSVEQMGRLVNRLDSVPLGRLFLPFLEAIIAAKGRLIVGTEHSTFSAFASSGLHKAYWAE